LGNHSDSGVLPRSLVQGKDGSIYVLMKDSTTAFDRSANVESPMSDAIFELSPAGQMTLYYSFVTTYGHDVDICPDLLASNDGNLYGTASFGQLSKELLGLSAVYRISPAGNLTVLHAFNRESGRSPNGLVQASDGDFFGTSSYGGERNVGTIFRVSQKGEFTLLHTFGQEP